MSSRATVAAHDLAAVLAERAEDLASDDLATISDAMSAVRGSARELESALTERGWGGDVLYGWGDSPDEDDEDDDEDDPRWSPPEGERMSYQARYDFVIVDDEAFLEYVVERAVAAGRTDARNYVLEHSPEFVLTELIGFAGLDLEGTGLKFAGGQDSVGPVPLTLWELDDEARDDGFPTKI